MIPVIITNEHLDCLIATTFEQLEILAAQKKSIEQAKISMIDYQKIDDDEFDVEDLDENFFDIYYNTKNQTFTVLDNEV